VINKETLLKFAKIEAKKRLSKALDDLHFLEDVVNTYVTDDMVKRNALKAIEYLREQINVVEKIVNEL